MKRLRVVNGNIYDTEFMSFDECIDTIKMLSHSQGMYGRLLRNIQELDDSTLEEVKEIWEDKKFKDNVDFILYIENGD
jgi:hypothetical protein